MKLPRWAWLVIVPLGGTLLLAWPLGLLDAWLASMKLFPAPVAGVGLASIAASALVAGTWRWPQGAGRTAAAVAVAVALSTLAVWGIRYAVWQTFGVQTEDRMATGAGTRLMLMQWGACLIAGGLGGAIAGVELRKPKHLLIHLAGLAIAVVCSEIIVSGLGIDAQLMDKALYYQTVEIEAHTPVDDAQLLYALKPNTVHGGEGPWGVRDVRINSHGARSPEFAADKADHIQRVLFFGGSTLYGAGVGNRQTLPAQLQVLMRQQYAATEIWNFGACAYNTAQSARLAKQKLSALDPDLILLLITNTGRRAFMGGPTYQGADKSSYFSANPFLYLENFPPVRFSEDTHLSLLQASALYRSWVAWGRVYTDPDTTYADRADQQQIDALEAAAAQAGVPVVYVLSPSRGSEIGPQDFGIPAQRWIDLNIEGRSGDYTEAHPPPTILAEYAATVAGELAQMGYGRRALTTDQ